MSNTDKTRGIFVISDPRVNALTDLRKAMEVLSGDPTAAKELPEMGLVQIPVEKARRAQLQAFHASHTSEAQLHEALDMLSPTQIKKMLDKYRSFKMTEIMSRIAFEPREAYRVYRREMNPNTTVARYKLASALLTFSTMEEQPYETNRTRIDTFLTEMRSFRDDVIKAAYRETSLETARNHLDELVRLPVAD